MQDISSASAAHRDLLGELKKEPSFDVYTTGMDKQGISCLYHH